MGGHMGRPEVITPEQIVLLKTAFAIGCTDEEACSYAKIPTSTFYDYQKRHPDFSEEKDRLKQTPILKARQELVKGLDGNPELSLRYLERKLKNEFSLRNEMTGADGEKLEALVTYRPKRDE